MLTPQEIKDQEFEIKFRGYEPNEVQTYLEQVSENFLELTNQINTQVKEIQDLKDELNSLALEKDALAAEVETLQNSQTEDNNKDEEIKPDDGSIMQAQNLIEIEKLRTKVELLEEMNKALKQDELDFKTTITAAQSFSNNLKEASEAEAQKLKEESEARAAALIEESEARAAELRETSEAEVTEQIEKLRNGMDDFKKQSEEDINQLLTEINDLKTQKEQVKSQLKNTLHFYLNALEQEAPLEEETSFESLESDEQIEVIHESEVEA